MSIVTKTTTTPDICDLSSCMQTKNTGNFLLNFFTLRILNLQTCVRYFIGGDTHTEGGEARGEERSYYYSSIFIFPQSHF